ncbi:EAL domain-containing protein [Candidatus Reidiella endopervernicosa]|uniref:EAL domain-containing protein n=1 Tax=Candidatus Reidiella endopervernicosa TaxID=2738883 RepID=A0A6N0I187_9GAMM|nr:EAL domain-containing protein [Candidatus Reidiella endopervernicosa]
MDKSFIDGIPDDPEDAAIVKAVIALGKGLEMKIVAEGVEGEDQRDYIAREGCDEVQGYLYAPRYPCLISGHYLSQISNIDQRVIPVSARWQA